MIETPINCLFDTTVFIDYWRGRASARAIIERSLNGELLGGFSILTDLELWVGVRDDRDARDHITMLSPYRRYPLNVTIARRSGELARIYRANNMSIPDLIIASTAEFYGLTLVSRNTSDFSTLVEDDLIELITY